MTNSIVAKAAVTDCAYASLFGRLETHRTSTSEHTRDARLAHQTTSIPIPYGASNHASDGSTVKRVFGPHFLTSLSFIFPSSPPQNGRFIPDKSNVWRDCCDGYYDWVKEHIEEGCPLDEADHCGDPPMLLAAGNGHTSCCDLLLSEGADIQQAGLMKETPLSRAAHNGHFHTVKFLVENGAEVDSLDIGDNSSLHWAAMRGHVEIVNYLLQNGSDKSIKNKQGKMAIDLCQPVWSHAWKYTRELLR